MTFPDILAKSNPKVPLLQHIEECLGIFGKVIVWKKDLIEKVAVKYAIDKNFLIQRLFLTVAFHDIGKATFKFQDRMWNEKKHDKESHALTSVPFLYDIVKDKPIYEKKNYAFYPELLSIVSHHSPFTKSLFEGYKNMKVQFVDDYYFQSYYDLINRKAKELHLLNWQDIHFQKSPSLLLPYEIYLKVIGDGLSKIGFIDDNTSASRDLLIVFKSILHYCDWIASSGNFSYKYISNQSPQTITERMKEKVATFSKWKDFQIQCKENYDKNLFVQISTGQGKSEAATLWALNNNENQKIIILLPTMVTTNKMWQRTKFLIGDDDIVGLSHSSAQYILKKEEEIEPESLRKHYLYNRTFFKPVTVATVDQLIYSFFNWGHWVLTASASYNARIIIDEIHIYDAYTFGLLLETINQIKGYNTQFAIMSASLPDVLREEINKVIPNSILIKDEMLNHLQRHSIQVSDKYIEEHTDDIINYFLSGKKVLVVANTIGKAREIFDAIIEAVPEEKRMLYHSQFILKHKICKENILENIFDQKGGFVAVCTQIVEVSLDIDFDVLITENAPIDAIIQRLGRVNRKAKISERIKDWQFGKVIITKESEKSREYIYSDYKIILDKTYEHLDILSKEKSGNLNEGDLKAIVEIVYTKENLGERYYDELEDARGLIKKIWKQVTKNLYTLKIEEANLHNIGSRKKTDYVTVECVLNKHNININFEEVIAAKNYDLLREYTIKLPLYLAKKNEYFVRKLNDSDVYLINMEYDEHLGISHKTDSEHLNFGL